MTYCGTPIASLALSVRHTPMFQRGHSCPQSHLYHSSSAQCLLKAARCKEENCCHAQRRHWNNGVVYVSYCFLSATSHILGLLGHSSFPNSPRRALLQSVSSAALPFPAFPQTPPKKGAANSDGPRDQLRNERQAVCAHRHAVLAARGS